MTDKVPGSARRTLLVLLGALVCSVSCARDPATLRWETALAAIEQHAIRGEHVAAVEGFQRLRDASPSPVDADLMGLAEASVLLRMNKVSEGLDLLEQLARTATRRSDRARARYEIARLSERLGYTELARSTYRKLVMTYPELMPGSTALLHLERLAKAGSADELHGHLEWALVAYPGIRHTSLGDNLVFFAASVADRAFVSGASPDAGLAERLYGFLLEHHPKENFANDAMWRLTYLYEASGDLQRSIATIRGIQRHRQKAFILGDYGHRYYWQGELRIARLLAEKLGKSREAIASYEYFVKEYPDHLWRDDALYWMACLKLRVGDRSGASDDFDEIKTKHPSSRYVGRIQAAYADPRERSCKPKEFGSPW